MWFLLDSHGYFEERTSVSFFQGLVAVFMNGGVTFITTMVTLLWISTGGGSAAVVVNEIGISLFTYSFFSSFIMWFLIAIMFYGFIVWDGVGRIDFFTVLNMAGMGFTPLVFSSIIEFVVTIYYANAVTSSGIATTTHILIGGEFGILPAIGMMLIHTITLVWAAHIWIGGMHQLGRVSPKKSTGIVTLVSILMLVELIFLALL